MPTRAIIDVAPLAPTLEAEARRLRGDGATIVIAIAHAGGRCTTFDDPADLSSCADHAEIFDVARALPSGLVDLIVAGHRHEGVAHEVAGIPVISSYSSGRAFGRVDLTVDRASGRVTGRHIFPPHDICERDDPATGACVAGRGRAFRRSTKEHRWSPSREIEAILAPAVAAAGVSKEQTAERDD